MSDNTPYNKGQQPSPLKKWLDRIQQDSWELELIFSGFAIFGLFRAQSALNAYALNNLPSVTQDALGSVVMFFLVAYG